MCRKTMQSKREAHTTYRHNWSLIQYIHFQVKKRKKEKVSHTKTKKNYFMTNIQATYKVVLIIFDMITRKHSHHKANNLRF